MAVATISGVGQNLGRPTGGPGSDRDPHRRAVAVLAVPLLDVALAIVRRMRKGIGIAYADKEHIHHRLMDIGHTHRQAVLLMYLWSAPISGCALVVAFVDGRTLVFVILATAVLVAAVLPRLIRDRTPRGSDAPTPEPEPESNRRAGRHRRSQRAGVRAATRARRIPPSPVPVRRPRRRASGA